MHGMHTDMKPKLLTDIESHYLDYTGYNGIFSICSIFPVYYSDKR